MQKRTAETAAKIIAILCLFNVFTFSTLSFLAVRVLSVVLFALLPDGFLPKSGTEGFFGVCFDEPPDLLLVAIFQFLSIKRLFHYDTKLKFK